MAFDYQRHDDERVVVLTGRGRIQAADLRRTIDRLVIDGMWAYGSIWDLGAAQMDLPSDDNRDVAAHVAMLSRPVGPRGPVAIVTNSDADDGVSRNAVTYAEWAGYEIRAFQSLDAALQWIRHVRRPATSVNGRPMESAS